MNKAYQYYIVGDKRILISKLLLRLHGVYMYVASFVWTSLKTVNGMHRRKSDHMAFGPSVTYVTTKTATSHLIFQLKKRLPVTE